MLVPEVAMAGIVALLHMGQEVIDMQEDWQDRENRAAGLVLVHSTAVLIPLQYLAPLAILVDHMVLLVPHSQCLLGSTPLQALAAARFGAFVGSFVSS
jgi:hypothetical protein